VRAAIVILLTAGALALGAGAASAEYRNPVLPGEYPDPSVVRVGGEFFATATSDRWAPAFPVLHSRDLVSWRQVGAVLPEAPEWARGKRFWAPEITWAHGRLVVLYAGLRRAGRFCIGAATAPRGQGPWTDRGALTCRPGGAIDPVAVRREDGTDWLVWKAKGVGGGLWIQQVDLAALEVVGSPVPLIAPDLGWERGVTEGPALVKRGPWWYLVYSAGNCCRPPCTYVTSVARAPSLLGPYVKARRPLLESGELLRCPGHGTLVDLPDGRLYYLHHAYAGGDVANRRRQGVLSPVTIGADGWPVFGSAGTPPAAGPAPLGGVQEPAAVRFADDFRSPVPGLGWQWIMRRDPPAVSVGDGRLELGCGTHALITRQVAADRFSVAVTVLRRRAEGDGGGDGVPALVVRDREGVQRGVEVRDGRVLAVRRRGDDVRLGPSVRVPRRRPVRLMVTVAPGGALAAYVHRSGRLVRVPEGPAALGEGPTRVGLSCRGTGTARFARFAVAALGDRPLGVPVADRALSAQRPR
jgi:GH43 family beta-xylosidase